MKRTPSDDLTLSPPGAPAQWARSIENDADSVVRDLETVTLVPPVVLSGFSIGSAIASHIITTNSLMAVKGLIVVAPSTDADFNDLRESSSKVPTLIVGGDQDSRREQYAELQAELRDHPHTAVEIIEGLGHSHPLHLGELVGGFRTHL